MNEKMLDVKKIPEKNIDQEKETYFLEKHRKIMLQKLSEDAMECALRVDIGFETIKFEAERINRELFNIGGVWADGSPYYEVKKSLDDIIRKNDDDLELKYTQLTMKRIAELIEKIEN